MHRVLRLAAITALALLAPATLRAQPTEPRLGERVRAVVAGDRVEGVLVETGADTIALAPRRGPVRRLARDSIASLELDRGGRRRGALVGLRWGTLAGLAIGAVALTQVERDDAERPPQPDAEIVMQALGFGATWGTIIGFAAGADLWVPVAARPARVGLAPARGGVAVVVSYRR